MPDVKIKGYSGNELHYADVPKVWLAAEESTEDNPVLLPFTYGEALDDVEIVPDFSVGDMQIAVPEGYLARSAVVKRPETLVPENVAEGVSIAGITGKLSASGGDANGIVARTATEINLPDADAGDYAFYNYKNLVYATVKNVGEYAFQGATNLENVVVTGTTIGRNAFYNESKLKTISVPNVTILGSMGSIFYGCTSLEEIVFPGAVSYISNGSYNFYGCSALKKIDFHAPVMLNAASIFQNCSALTAIIMRGNKLYSVYNAASSTSTSAILKGAPNAKFYVPAAMMESYAANANWNTYITAGRLLTIEDHPEICG